MLDDARGLPSFSNDPEQFGDMTLFVGQYGLTLHITTDAEFRMETNVPLLGIAEYYAGYVQNETAAFMSLGEYQMRHLERSIERLGGSLSLTFEDRKKRVAAYARYFAQSQAMNCGDSHDLSDEFCAAAKNLGEALQARVDAGVEMITVIQSGNPAEKFMALQHG